MNNYTVTFKAGYDREGVITVENAVCHRCGKKGPCMSIDSSEDEYGPGRICLPCATVLTSRFALPEEGYDWNEKSKV